MTLREKMTGGLQRLCDFRSECSRAAIRSIVAGMRERNDGVVVFRRDAATGRYDMSTACCEEVLDPVCQ